MHFKVFADESKMWEQTGGKNCSLCQTTNLQVSVCFELRYGTGVANEITVLHAKTLRIIGRPCGRAAHDRCSKYRNNLFRIVSTPCRCRRQDGAEVEAAARKGGTTFPVAALMQVMQDAI